MTSKTPSKIKELSGNPGKRAINKKEPKPKSYLATPKTLTSLASMIWKKVVSAMPPGLYASVDEGILAAYCEAYANHQTATAQTVQTGRYAPGSMGQQVLSAAAKDQSDQARLMVTLSAKLGFDPISRMSLETDDQDDGANWLN